MEENWHFDMAKRYFDLGIYKDKEVRLFVLADRITKLQFKEITGKNYDELSTIPVEVNI